MNRDDTERYHRWLYLRHHCKRLMAISLVLAALWALFPLGVPVVANSTALNDLCDRTSGCETARLCSGWPDKDDDSAEDVGKDWRPEMDVCMRGHFPQDVEVLPAGTTKRWVPAGLRPLLSNRNRVWWRTQP